jgi:hypothetical protein
MLCLTTPKVLNMNRNPKKHISNSEGVGDIFTYFLFVFNPFGVVG